MEKPSISFWKKVLDSQAIFALAATERGLVDVLDEVVEVGAQYRLKARKAFYMETGGKNKPHMFV